jgi:hypothetical protein
VRLDDPVLIRRFEKLLSLWSATEQSTEDFLEQLKNSEKILPDDASATEVRWSFLLSLLTDLVHWGSLPHWDEDGFEMRIPRYGSNGSSEQENQQIRSALQRLRGVTKEYLNPVSPERALSILTNGKFRLNDGTGGNAFSEIFREGVATWSMPYRTREGRASRLVLTADFQSDIDVPVGILEIGDDAPHNPVRDSCMGFDSRVSDLSRDECSKLAERFVMLRGAIHQDGLPVNVNAPAEEILSQFETLREASKGRSKASEISRNKRIAYLLRFVQGEAALRQIGTPEGLLHGLRALRDLTIPRVTAEMTICGALPPFGPLLAGKIVAGMAAHPLVRRFTYRDFGEITRSSFEVRKLEQLLPNLGTILITTKGLYPGHSSQYNRVQIPGISGPIQMRKVGDTIGQTTSHISISTSELASRAVQMSNSRTVSNIYGSGGAKRQRIISEAIRELGSNVDLAHANVSRPVYAVSLVANLREVILFNKAPIWLVKPIDEIEIDGTYEEAALLLWRDKWLTNAVKRGGL